MSEGITNTVARRYLPWIGSQYHHGVFNSGTQKRVLILGLSHYQWDENIPIENYPNLTVDCIHAQITGNETKRFWTNINKMFLGQLPSIEDKSRFWHTVSFMNYIQFPILSGPKNDPEEFMWEASEQFFFEMMELLKPNYLLILGSLNGDRNPCMKQDGVRWIEMVNHFWKLSGNYMGAEVVCVKHPGLAFSADTFHPYLKDAIKY